MAKNQRRTETAAFPIVGLGASAGGLEAVTELLEHLPEDTGLGFVLVQHLDPKHESALTALLARATKMPVAEARHQARVEPNHVYVIPPNKTIKIVARRLKLAPRQDDHLPIDHFLQSLAEDQAGRAIGVVLSGSGSDGTQGLLAIKAGGGVTFAQTEASAKYPPMPASAVMAGCVDYVLPPAKIAQELVRIAGHPYVAPAAVPAEEPAAESSTEAKSFEEIFLLLRQRTRVDFTYYKHATLRRRIQRRMLLNKLESLRDYVRFLRSHPPEVMELYHDILIHVTGFFRDATMYAALKKKVFPRLLRERTADDPIRLWVQGCASGEEAYSLAILLLEFLSERKLHFPIQVFATDINDQALETARQGLYPAGIADDVSPERLRRFFIKTQDGYRIVKSVRELCIFARQNVSVDPPFSNIDLLTCRNVLIYLGPTLQRKVFPLFHYALKPSGFLVLGASETVGNFADLFALVDKKAKIYTKKFSHIRSSVGFTHGVFELKLHPEAAALKPEVLSPLTIGDVQKQADRILLNLFTPPGVVINQQFEVVQFRGRTGDFLEHAHGDASLNLLKMVREGMMAELRATVMKALKQNGRARLEGVHVKINGHFGQVDLEVVPFNVPPAPERFCLVLFQQPSARAARPYTKAARHQGVPTVADLRELERLREELSATRESLQAIIEEQESTNEELRSANEEIMSANEELQSTNEELETAKEELQSTNEELTTLNDELESRNGELDQANNDLRNLLASANIPIIMVGADLRIRRFTVLAEKLNLIAADIGRPLSNIKLNVEVPNLQQCVTEVIETLQTRVLETTDRDGQRWSIRIRPYKTSDNKIEGAVIAFVKTPGTEPAATP